MRSSRRQGGPPPNPMPRAASLGQRPEAGNGSKVAASPSTCSDKKRRRITERHYFGVKWNGLKHTKAFENRRFSIDSFPAVSRRFVACTAEPYNFSRPHHRKLCGGQQANCNARDHRQSRACVASPSRPRFMTPDASSSPPHRHGSSRERSSSLGSAASGRRRSSWSWLSRSWVSSDTLFVYSGTIPSFQRRLIASGSSPYPKPEENPRG